MARTIQQITKEIQGQFAPTIAELKKQQSRIGQSLKSEEAGLKAQQDQAFGDILLGAKRRGLKFSGIPLAEQSRYTSTEFLPALARLRQSAGDQRSQLALSIADVLNRRGTLAQELRQKELDRELSERLERERLAASRAAGSGGGSANPFAGLLSGLGGGGGQTKAAQDNPALQKLFNRVFVKSDGTFWDDRSLVSDYNATLRSAQYGNRNDQQKIRLYHSARPDLFGATTPSLATNVVPFKF